jgi:hypothetical protein
MTRITAARQNHCELCDCLVTADAYTPCCGKFLCAVCAQRTHCPICQTPKVSAPSPVSDDWLEEDYELRVSGYDE